MEKTLEDSSTVSQLLNHPKRMGRGAQCWFSILT